ncbi:hypothetical protein LJC11_05885, partial [Bacteroidales bacterium OttesenSCG-928-I21]|nr:hypothetical protein [Bacteroidales bacterium OttesenSCG-928-I21]
MAAPPPGTKPSRSRSKGRDAFVGSFSLTENALKNAKLDQDYLDTHEVGILYGNDSSADPVVKSIDILREKKDSTLIGSGAIFQSMNSTVTMNLACI